MNDVTRIAYDLARDFEDKDKGALVQRSLWSHVTWMDKVKAFHVLYNCPIVEGAKDKIPQMTDDRLKLRVELIDEEFKELKKAVDERDVVELADGLGDLIYVVCGFALEAGIDLTAVLNEIHASNMTKSGEDGNPVVREDGKVLKGPKFQKPDLKNVLFNSNYKAA